MFLKFARLIPLLSLAFFCSMNLHAAAAPKPQTVPELINIAKNANTDPEVRRDAINKLGSITEADERNFNVVGSLVEVVKTSLDPFVPVSAVRVETQLHKNVTKSAKTKFIKPFIELLSKKDAIPGVRSAIAECFREVLEPSELNDQDAYKALVAIAGNKAEPNLALRGKCIEAVGAFGIEGKGGLEMLGGLLSEVDPYIKEAAATAITYLLDRTPDAGKDVPLAATNKLLELMRDEKLMDDLRVKVIKVIAQMTAGGNTAAGRGVEDIIKLAKNSQKDVLVLAAIQGLGIIGTKEAADPLIGTYNDYFSKETPAKETDVPVRIAVVKALRSLLSVQASKAAPDMDTVKKVSTHLILVLDTDPVVAIKASTIYALGYLYPKKFEPTHKEAVGALVYLLRNTQDASLKAMIPDTLEAITRVNFGQDWKRWEEWAQKAYPGIKI